MNNRLRFALIAGCYCMFWFCGLGVIAGAAISAVIQAVVGDDQIGVRILLASGGVGALLILAEYLIPALRRPRLGPDHPR